LLQSTLVKQRDVGTAARVWSAERITTWFLLGVMLVASFVMGVLTLMRTPLPMNDEAWNAARAWQLIQSGRAFSSLDSGVFDRFDGYWTMFPWLGVWFQSLAVRALGLSLESVRMASLVFGMVLLVAVFAIGNRVGGPRVGLLSVLLLSLSRSFIYSSHLARYDVMVAAFGFGAIALYLYDRGTNGWLKSLLAGLAVGLAFELHAYGAIFGPVLLVLLLIDHGWSIVRARRAWAFGVGVLGGLAFYVAMHILPYPQTFATLQGLAFGATHTPPLLTFDPGIWLGSLADTARLFLDYSRWRIPLIVAALIFFWRWRSTPGSRLVVLFLALVLTFAALIRNKTWFQYAILIFPSVDLVVAAFMVALWDRLARVGSSVRVWPYLRIGLMLLLLAAAILPGQRRILANHVEDYEVTLSHVKAAIPAGSVVMGPQIYWFSMPEERYLSWEGIIFYERYAPGSTTEQSLQALHPDYFIIDGPIERFLWGEKGLSMSAYAQPLHVPQEELMGFLNRRAQLVSTVETETFGNVRIYKIDWTR
jgi:4-amino-4-deoxy-L-arabinose transferase-like glycosyltransferase